MAWLFPSLQPDLPGSLPQLRWLGDAGQHGARDRAAPDDELAAAFEHFARGDWSAAERELARLADGGDPHAARIASMMRSRGRRLLGGPFVDFTTLERARAEPTRASSAGVSTRIALAAVALVAGMSAAALSIVAGGSASQPLRDGALLMAPPPVADVLPTVPPAADVLYGGDDAPEADPVPYGG
jgi:hypothetical protein